MTQPLIDPRDELLCLRAHQPSDENGGAVLPPIVQASLFRQPDMASLYDGFGREHELPIYSRGTNPTVAALEAVLAELERGETCRCFASGMGAIAAALTGVLKSGDHVLFAGTIYGPTLELMERLEEFGISWDRTAATDIDGIAADLRPETRVLYMESPGSALFGLLPIADLAALAKERGVLTMLDNSVATPLLQKPLEMGVDLVLHSCSKYIGGHSDLIGGALIGSAALVEQIFYKSYLLLGAVMAPFTAWLCLRALMTLPVRIARHHADALELAHYLQGHSRVRRVLHPALSGDPLVTQMRGHSGLFSFEIDGNFDDAVRAADRLQLFGRAVSWGGPESLVITGHKKDPGPDSTSPVPASLLRLSVGFEGLSALVDDLESALE